MLRAVLALVFGVRAVLRAPLLVLTTYLVLIAAVVPAAIALMRTLAGAFEQRQVERVLPAAADDAWFARAGETTRAVAGDSFSPAAIGFAAPLSNLADLVEGRPGTAATIATLALWLIAWSFLLGGVLHRLASGRAIGIGGFIRACSRRMLPFTTIAVAMLVAYATAALLYQGAAGGLRIAVLIALAATLGGLSVVASYIRARIAVRDVPLLEALSSTLRMIRAAPLTCGAHALIALSAWAVLLAAFAAVDLYAGRGGGPWRAPMLAQVYLLGRVTGRLVWEASALKLVGEPRD